MGFALGRQHFSTPFWMPGDVEQYFPLGVQRRATAAACAASCRRPAASNVPARIFFKLLPVQCCDRATLRSAARQLQRPKGRLPPEQHLPFSWKRKSRAVSCCASAGTAAAGTTAQTDTRQHRWRVPDVFGAWSSWWHLDASDQMTRGSRPQSLRSIVVKLWRLMRVNKVLLAGAFVCMVRRPCGMQ